MEPTFPQKTKRRRKRRKTDCWLWNIPTFLTLIKADLKILKISQGKKWLNYYVNMKKRTHFPQRIHKLSKTNICFSHFEGTRGENPPKYFALQMNFENRSFHFKGQSHVQCCIFWWILDVLKNLRYFEESLIFWRILDILENFW